MLLFFTSIYVCCAAQSPHFSINSGVWEDEPFRLGYVFSADGDWAFYGIDITGTRHVQARVDGELLGRYTMSGDTIWLFLQHDSNYCRYRGLLVNVNDSIMMYNLIDSLNPSNVMQSDKEINASGWYISDNLYQLRYKGTNVRVVRDAEWQNMWQISRYQEDVNQKTKTPVLRFRSDSLSVIATHFIETETIKPYAKNGDFCFEISTAKTKYGYVVVIQSLPMFSANNTVRVLDNTIRPVYIQKNPLLDDIFYATGDSVENTYCISETQYVNGFIDQDICNQYLENSAYNELLIWTSDSLDVIK